MTAATVTAVVDPVAEGAEQSDRWPTPVPADVVRQRRRAQDPATTPPELQATMLTCGDPGARRAVLANQSCPDWIRQAAAVDDPDPDVRAAAVRTAADPVGACRWVSDPAWQVRAELARRHDTDPMVLVDLGQNDHDGLVRRSALANPGFPPDVLLDVLTGQRDLEAETAAASPALDLSSVVERIGLVLHDPARAIIAARRDTPPAMLGRLGAQDPSPRVRVIAVGREGFPADLLAPALDDHDPAVRWAAVTHPRLPVEALTRAAASPDPAVRGHAVAHPAADPAVVGRLATADPAAAVRRSACGNPGCPVAALATAANGDADPAVRAAAVANPACPSTAVDAACADPALRVRLAAIGNPCVTEQGAFTCLTARAPRQRRPRNGRAGTPVAGPGPGDAEAVTKAARAVLAATAWQRLRRLPLHTLAKAHLRVVLAPHLPEAARYDQAAVRALVASHPDVPAATLAGLAADPDPRVRRAATTRLLDAVSPRRSRK